jgi:hypothetical protein
MDNSCGRGVEFADRERGAARLKFLVIIALVAVVAYAGYQYIPVAYQASMYKTAMQDAVRQSIGHPNDWLRNQLRTDANYYNVPPDAEITVERNADGPIQARVQYNRPVNLFGYTYTYKFDYTAKSNEWLSGK